MSNRLNKDRALEVAELIRKYGDVLRTSDALGLSISSIDRYVREAKRLNLLGENVRLIGNQFYDGDERLGTPGDMDAISSLVEREKVRRGFSDDQPYIMDPPEGTHITIDIGDLHATDEDFLWESFFSMIHNVGNVVSSLKPKWVTVRGFGDWITGRGIYRGQEVRNITNHAHWQTLIGGYLLVLIEQELRSWFGDDVFIEWEYIKGNHDEVDRGAVNLAYYLCNEAWASFGIPIHYAGTETVANYGTTDKPVWALVVHGFGGGDYSPHSNSLLRKLSKRIANLNADRMPEEAITELRHGHTHWLNARGLCYTRKLTVYCVGGFQRNKRPELGQEQRPTGAIITIADGENYNTIGAVPNDEVFANEINSPDLEFKNMERIGGLLRSALQYRDEHIARK